MNFEIFGYIELFLLVICAFVRIEKVIIIMGCLSMYMAASGVSIGAFTINPAVLFLPLFVIRAFLMKKRGDKKSIFSHPAPLLFLLFLSYALVVTALCPILFAGQIDVVWCRHNATAESFHKLMPDIGNFTQSFYLCAAFICYISACKIFWNVRSEKVIPALILIVSTIHIFWAALDLTFYYAGLSGALDFIRNGNYSSGDQAFGGLKRIAGTFTEASFFATNTLALFAFCQTLFFFGYRKLLSGSVSLCLFLLLILSTSTTAYVGLALYLSWLGVSFLAERIHKGSRKRSSKLFLGAYAFGIITLIIIFAFFDASSFLDALVFKKASTDSGVERTFWNLTALNAFFETFGLGVGVGSTRSSSFLVTLLSNTGLIGFLLYFSFTLRALKKPPQQNNPDKISILLACREYYIGFLIGTSLSYTVLEVGFLPYIVLAAATALSRRPFNEGPYFSKKRPFDLSMQEQTATNTCAYNRKIQDIV